MSTYPSRRFGACLLLSWPPARPRQEPVYVTEPVAPPPAYTGKYK
jgi:hypothetical protein